MNITPSIGAVGIFRLKEPFDLSVIENVQYACISVKTIREASISELDFQETVYTAKGITQELYEQDLNANINIITIQNSIGDKLLVPSTYILKIPDINGVEYVPLIMGINLGVLPSKVNLAPMKQKLVQVINEYIGVENAEVKEMISGASVIISDTDHAGLESTRQNRIFANETDYTKYVAMKRERDALLLKNTALETYIKNSL